MRPRSHVLAVIAWTGLSVAGAQVVYEEHPTLKAEDVLSADLLEGPHHVVSSVVPTDGFMAYVTIESDFGTFHAASLEEGVVRVREIYAIAALDEMRRHELAGEGLVEGLKQPVLAVESVVTRPEDTARGVGDGLGRWVGRGKLSLHKLKRKAEKARDSQRERRDEELAEQEVRDRAVARGEDPDAAVREYRGESSDGAPGSELAAESDLVRNQERISKASKSLGKAALKHFGYDRARRQLAAELGVDPYSSNLVLQQRLDHVAWALWAGHLTAGLAVPTGQLLGQVADINDLVWTSHPRDLEVRNRKLLRGIGLDKDPLAEFFENPNYPTTDRTLMISEVGRLKGVEGRPRFFLQALHADTPLLGAYYRRTAQLLVRAHQRDELDRIAPTSDRVVIALSRSGGLFLFLAVDHLGWNKDLDLLVSAVAKKAEEAGFEGQLVLEVSGRVSKRVEEELVRREWKVVVGEPSLG